MANDQDKTLKLVTNLDRGAIEGMPRAEMEKRVRSALQWLADKPQHNNLRGQLEIVELNLPNLK